jgi:sec-independent protein translocase protein TatB
MDSFFGIGIAELFFIAVIALIVLGPERLPGALREVAKVIRTVRGMTNELMGQFGDEMKVFDDLNPQKLLRELIDDPAEKSKAKAATPAKPVTKPAAKPATSSTAKPTTTKAATPKPVTTPKPATPKVASTTATSKPKPTTGTQPVEGETIVAGAGEVATGEVASAEGISAEISNGESDALGAVSGTVALSGVATGAVEDAPAVVLAGELDEQSILPPDRLAQVETQPAETQIAETQVELIDTNSVELVQIDPAEDAPDHLDMSGVEDSATETAVVPSATVATSEVEEPDVAAPDIESEGAPAQKSLPDVVSESASEVVVETTQASVSVNGNVNVLNKHSASKNGASAEGDA